MTLTRLIAFFITLGFASLCSAGDAGPPIIVWINFDTNDKSVIDDKISAIVLAEDPMCWDASEQHIYMKIRPHGLTNELAHKALVENNRTAIKKINVILANYTDKYTKGLDGIIAYVPGPPSRMIGLTRGRYKSKTQAIDSALDAKGDLNAIEFPFCKVMPETVREP